MDTKAVIEHWYKKLRFPDRLGGAFYRALNSIPVPEDVTLESYDLGSKDGARNLLTFLYLCEETHARAAALGIPENVITDTLGDIVICTEDNSAVRGELYLGQLKWLRLHLSLKLFRLGRLQFCMAKAPRDIPAAGVSQNDPVLEIHVPRGGKLPQEACLNSLTQAKAFFPAHFPEFGYKVFLCYSWLLDDALESYLPGGSNILRFAKLFERVYQTETYDILGSVFRIDTTPENLSRAECTSAFAQRIKVAVLSGEKFHTALGFIAAEGRG